MFFALRILCIRNNYFTCGSNDQYEKMFEMAEKGATAHEVALVIWICSKEAELTDIESKVKKIIDENSVDKNFKETIN